MMLNHTWEQPSYALAPSVCKMQGRSAEKALLAISAHLSLLKGGGLGSPLDKLIPMGSNNSLVGSPRCMMPTKQYQK